MKKALNYLKESLLILGLLASPAMFIISFGQAYILHDYTRAIYSAITALLFSIWDIEKKIKD